MPITKDRFLESADRPRFLHDFYVTGSGQFPYDMLRYDECWPANAVDANMMAQDWASGRRSVHLRSYREPTPARWNSFTWTVSRDPMVALDTKEKQRPWQHMTDGQFGEVLNEFRDRGYAIAVYGIAELGEGPLQDRNGDYDPEKVGAWLKENRGAVEEIMSGAVWGNFSHVGDEIHGGSSDG